MKTISSTLQTLFSNSDQFYMADLYTFYLLNGGYDFTNVSLSGDVLRLTTADTDIVSGGYTFSSVGPLLDRSKFSWKIGAATDTLQLTVYPSVTNLVNNYPFLQAIQYGIFDGAEVQVERAFMPTWGDVSAGTLIMFVGRVAEIDSDRAKAVMKINSHLEILSIQMPRNLYCPTCWLNLYDQACQVSQAAWTFTGTVGSNPTVSTVPVVGVSQADGVFDQGWATFQNGLFFRTIKTWAGNTVNLLKPLPALALPNHGDSITLVAGCDTTMTTCQSKFNNLRHFRGQPYVPVPETAY